VDGVVHERDRLFTLRTTPGREIVEARLPVTSRPILVRASCRLALLHTSRAASAFSLETWWMREGGNAADLPDTGGEDFLFCRPGPLQRLTETIDPAWLPYTDDTLRLTWLEQDTVADTPSNSPASWALAVYVAR
jgi:hypothetical protein